jgi:hypothetical protein
MMRDNDSGFATDFVTVVGQVKRRVDAVRTEIRPDGIVEVSVARGVEGEKIEPKLFWQHKPNEPNGGACYRASGAFRPTTGDFRSMAFDARAQEIVIARLHELAKVDERFVPAAKAFLRDAEFNWVR